MGVRIELNGAQILFGFGNVSKMSIYRSVGAELITTDEHDFIIITHSFIFWMNREYRSEVRRGLDPKGRAQIFSWPALLKLPPILHSSWSRLKGCD